jgi:hypothetical protein
MSLLLHHPRHSFVVPRTQQQRILDRAERSRFEVLQGIDINAGSRRWDIADASAHSSNTVFYGIKYLLLDGYIGVVGPPKTRFFITERGKIALAIWRGRQHRARQRQ